MSTTVDTPSSGAAPTSRTARLTGERCTICRDAEVSGIGLHFGRTCRLVFRPAPSAHGISFRRTDRAGAKAIPARVAQAVEAERRTQLGIGDEAVHTIEHVLAAVGALGIDDLLIEMDGPEPPIMDGSAEPFVAALLGAGLKSNGGRPEWLVLRKPIRVADGESPTRHVRAVACRST